MARGRSRGRRRGGAQHEEGNERWLLTYADMITLLMALFMVLFSISSVNISKYQTLQESLRAAFSGNILPGGRAIAKPGASSSSSRAPSSLDVQAIVPVTAMTASGTQAGRTQGSASAAATAQASRSESAVFAHVKQQLDAYAAAHGFAKSVQTSIERRGLVIRVLTDELLFPSGQATLEGRSHALLAEIAGLLNIDSVHPINVEGNTDNVPIQGAAFPSNWELSTARASTVVRYLVEHGVGAHRLTATGYADQHPLASDATPAGRARNRRVEIVMQRIYKAEGEP
jgi:chemotaxis protein MotB